MFICFSFFLVFKYVFFDSESAVIEREVFIFDKYSFDEVDMVYILDKESNGYDIQDAEKAEKIISYLKPIKGYEITEKEFLDSSPDDVGDTIFVFLKKSFVALKFCGNYLNIESRDNLEKSSSYTYFKITQNPDEIFKELGNLYFEFKNTP